MSLGTFEVTLQCRDLFFFSNVHAMKSMLLDFCDTFLCFLPCVRYLEQFPLYLRFFGAILCFAENPSLPIFKRSGEQQSVKEIHGNPNFRSQTRKEKRKKQTPFLRFPIPPSCTSGSNFPGNLRNLFPGNFWSFPGNSREFPGNIILIKTPILLDFFYIFPFDQSTML